MIAASRLPVAGTTPPPAFLPALTGLAVLAAPAAVAGEVGSLISGGPELATRVLAGCAVAADLLFVLGGVALAWRTPSGRRRFRWFGVAVLLAGLAASSVAALLEVTGPETVPAVTLGALGRALAAIGTGTMTVYWLRANTGSVRPPAHRPAPSERARTSRTAPLLALAGLVLCAVRIDVLSSVFFLPVPLLSAWLVVTLVRAPHAALARLLDRLGRAVSRRVPGPAPVEPSGPVKHQIILPEPVAAEQNPDGTYVTRSGRVIDLDQIPAELRLLPLPRQPEREEQPEGTRVQTE